MPMAAVIAISQYDIIISIRIKAELQKVHRGCDKLVSCFDLFGMFQILFEIVSPAQKRGLWCYNNCY